jgi:hypothetical protein
MKGALPVQGTCTDITILCQAHQINGKRLDVTQMVTGALRRQVNSVFPSEMCKELWQTEWKQFTEQQKAVIRKINMSLHGWHCHTLPSLMCAPVAIEFC